MSNQVKVWCRFTKVWNGRLVNFRVQDLADHDFEPFLNLYINYFVPVSPIHKFTTITQNKEAIEEYRQGFQELCKALNRCIYVCCIDHDSEETKIVAASFMSLIEKNEKLDMAKIKSMFQAKEIKQILDMLLVLHEASDVFEGFNVDSYYKGEIIVVHPDYRGLRIPTELLRARNIMCKERSVPLITGWMATNSTRAAATSLGWVTIRELMLKDIAEKAGIEKAGDFNHSRDILSIMALKF